MPSIMNEANDAEWGANNKRRKTILYVEANEDGTVGGSYFSLQLLVQCLDKSLYNPIVVLYEDIPLAREMFSELSELVLLDRRVFQAKKCSIPVLRPFLATYRKAKNLIFRVIIPFAKIITILIRNRVDMVHLNNSASVCWDWLLAAKILRKPCIAHQRGEFPVTSKTIKQAKRFDKIICISKAIQQPFELNHIDNTQLVYNPIDVECFTNLVKKEKQAVRKEFLIDPHVSLIGMVGNFQEWKGHITLIKAVHLLKDKFPRLVCLLIGALPVNNAQDKIYFNKVKKLIEELGLGENIIITGFRRDIPDLINSLDIQLHCSISPEPFGRVLIEGMCLEKVVVATDIGGPCEIIEDGISGFLLPPGDPETLQKKIGYLLENKEVRQEIGKAALKRVIDKFSLAKFEREIHKCYMEVVS